MNNYAFLGIVRQGRFAVLAGETASTGLFRLTSASLQAGQAPESGLIALDQYDGLAILVRGIGQNDWIYSAQIVEQASQILSVVVQVLFSEPGKRQLAFPQG